MDGPSGDAPAKPTSAWELWGLVAVVFVVAVSLWYALLHEAPQILFVGLFLAAVVLFVAFLPRLQPAGPAGVNLLLAMLVVAVGVAYVGFRGGAIQLVLGLVAGAASAYAVLRR